MHLGRRTVALAGAGSSQRRDGGAFPGKLSQISGPRVSATVEALDRRVWAALRDVQDPEMPVKLVDLGLIYGVETLEGHVRVRLTFTAMGCPATEMIMDDIRERLLREPGVASVDLDVVWDP